MTPRGEQDRCRTQAELEALARRRGYTNPAWWAARVLAGRMKKAKTATAVTFKGERV